MDMWRLIISVDNRYVLLVFNNFINFWLWVVFGYYSVMVLIRRLIFVIFNGKLCFLFGYIVFIIIIYLYNIDWL